MRAVRGLAILGAGLAAGCDQLATPAPQPDAPQPAPVAAPAPPPGPDLPEVSPQSDALRVHYRRVQNDLLTQGLLRTEGGGPDAQFTDTMLARNFMTIAFFDEYTFTPAGLREVPAPSPLRRWDRPVRFAIEFGDTIPPEQRSKDARDIRDYVARLSRATDHPMSVAERGANFHVLVLNEDDRADYGPRLRQLVPGIDPVFMRAFMEVPRETFCLVIAFSDGTGPTYSKAVALIRGEHPDLMRLACIHEELAQGLGLANDSPRARPSIFNDDEEFALLTAHDELLLKMLYDPRLRPGMEADEAAPLVRQIAAEVMGSGPS